MFVIWVAYLYNPAGFEGLLRVNNENNVMHPTKVACISVARRSILTHNEQKTATTHRTNIVHIKTPNFYGKLIEVFYSQTYDFN